MGASYDLMNVAHMWLHCNDVIHSAHIQISFYKNCLYGDNV